MTDNLTKKLTRSVLLPNSDGLLLEEFEKEYRLLTGQSFPYYSHNYMNALELVKSMPDVVSVEVTSSGRFKLRVVPDVSTQHLTRMVLAQRKKLEEKENVNVVKQQKLDGAAWRDRSGKENVEQQKVVGSEWRVKSEKENVNVVQQQKVDGGAWRDRSEKENVNVVKQKLDSGAWRDRSEKESVNFVKQKLDGGAWRDRSEKENVNVIQQHKVDGGAWRERSEKEMWINEKMKSNLRAILSHHPDGLPAYQLCREYEKHHGVDLDIRYWGCQSVVEFCAQLPQIFTMVRGGFNDWVLYSPRKNESDSGCGETHYGSRGGSVTIPLIDRNTFVSRCDSDASRNSKMDAMSDSVLLPSDTVKTKSRNIPGMDSMKLNQRCANVIGPDDNIPSQELPSNVKVGDFIDVLVAEVVSPRRFWIQLKGEDTSKALESLMEEMEDFYENSSQEYKVPEAKIEVGLTCVTPDKDGYFYRAFVTSFKDLTTVEVFYIDYGNVFKVKKDTLLCLHRKFAKLPAQAFAARLHRIKPSEGKRVFSKESSKLFVQLARKTEDMGLVAVVCSLGERLSLWLVDTSSNDLPQGVAINQVLVDEGLAAADAVEVEETAGEETAGTRRMSLVDHRTPLRRPTLELGNNQRVEVMSQQMQQVNLGIDNSTDQETLKKTLLAGEKDKDLLETKVGEHDCHIVIKSGSAWMTSQEVSRFIPNWKGKNILSTMLSLKRMHVPSLTITPASDSSLYSSLKVALKDEDCNEFVLYPLKSIPNILNVFLQVPGTQIRVDLQFQIENFERKTEKLS